MNLKRFIEENGLTQASVARSIGETPAAISGYITGQYAERGGNVEALEAKIKTYIENYAAPKAQGIKPIETTDFIMVSSTCDEVAVSGGMGAIYGSAGSGKTVAIKAWKKQHPEAVLIETVPMTSVKELLSEILEQLGQKNATGTAVTLVKEIVKLLKKSNRILLIDEAENLTTKSLEAIRRIHDFSGVPVVLSGTYALLQNLKGRNGELLQLYSRISSKWEMQGLNEQDRKALFGELGSVIKRFTTDIRRSVHMHNKAKRLAALANETLGINHINMAANTVILN